MKILLKLTYLFTQSLYLRGKMENLQAHVVIEYVEQEEGYHSGKHFILFQSSL